MRKAHLGWFLQMLAAALYGLAACSPAAPGVANTGAKPAAARVDVLRLQGGDYGYPQPFTRNNRGPGYINLSLIFDTLVWKDASGNYLPWLAESWTSSSDGLKWTFQLRKNVKWQDGQPFSAEDVVFSYQYYLDHPGVTAISRPDLIGAIGRTGDYTFEVTLKQVYAPFLRNVAGYLPILPKHIWQGVDDPQKFTDAKAVIGTGPYRLTSYDPAEGTYLYEANEDFWLGKPYVKRIELVPAGDAALALKQGDLQAADISGYSSGSGGDALQALKQDGRFGVLTGAGEWQLVLYFNLKAGTPLNDRAFRQAVAYSLDLQAMVDRILLGDGRVGMPAWAAPESVWKNPDVKAYPYDPAKAQSMLESAGYRDQNGDGKRELPDGKPLSLELVAPTTYPRQAEMVKTWLGAVGIDLRLKTVDQTTADQMTGQGKYQMALIGHGGLGADPESLMDIFSSQSKSKSFSKVQGYQNARFDELAAQQVHTVDETARRQMVFEMESILAQDLPVIPLYYPNKNLVYDKSILENWYFTPGGIATGIPTAWNKQLYVTGEKTGLVIRGSD